MSTNQLLEILGYIIYAAQAVAAICGLFIGVLLARKITQKSMSARAAQAFEDDVRSKLQMKDFDGVAEICDTPQYWAKATPQLILVALANRSIGPTRLREMLAERFDREVVADLQYRNSWITVIVKVAPMLGLLGTVQGMILAFAKIAESSKQGGTDPAVLASDISFALLTTFYGLAIAIPMTMIGAWVSVRIGKLADAVQDQIGEFMSDLEAAMKR